MKTRVMLVDDDRELCDTLSIGLARRGYDVRALGSADEALEAAATSDVDVVVTDLNMRKVNGVQLCERLLAIRPGVPVIVLTAFGSLDTAVAAIRAGAYDFISKPVEVDVLALAIDRAERHRQLGEEVKRLRVEAGRAPRIDELIGESEPMRAVYNMIERVADSDATVLTTGESGTGKEIVARAIHRRSRRKDAPFVALNCAAMPESLLESELFGHVKGAFTDAKASHPGLFALANGGTVFLDEIGDMPLGLQPKLLRVLQERVVRPVGGRSEIPIDVRVIAATNRDLESAIEEGTFREDLYYRVNVVHIALPALRERRGDILPLAAHFIRVFAAKAQKDIKGLAAPAAEKLVSYAWPGNVRELQNSIERAVALARFEQITVDDLPERVRERPASLALIVSDDPSELVPMDEIERRYVARVMHAVNGNKTAAARILGFDRKRLYRMLDRFGLDSKK